jgi:DNA-binding transcriptional regulator GbsR (MarR family)
VAFFAEAVQIFGVPKSVGLIYGLLFASPEPLSFSDIVERLEISKGSASQGLQLLRALGAIKQVLPSNGRTAGRSGPHSPSPLTPSGADGSRREYFEPELGLRKLVSSVLQERVTPLAAAGADRLARLRELAEQDGEGSDFCLNRVKQLETWRWRLRTVLPVLSALLGPKRRK